MNSDVQLAPQMLSILETDPAWCAYALGDLCPPWSTDARWITDEHSLVMIYGGLNPPLLFAHGEPDGLRRLFAHLPGGKYWYTLRPTDYALFGERLRPESRTSMWRMRLMHFRPRGPERAERLSAEHLVELEQLYGDHPDRPDAFNRQQLLHGVYHGVRQEGVLISAAGTHVICSETRAAAVGNVFTLPPHRGHGYARAATSAVIADLLATGIETIVLNVEMDNRSAVDLYRGLGFMPYCGFYEGIARLSEIQSEDVNV